MSKQRDNSGIAPGGGTMTPMEAAARQEPTDIHPTDHLNDIGGGNSTPPPPEAPKEKPPRKKPDEITCLKRIAALLESQDAAARLRICRYLSEYHQAVDAARDISRRSSNQGTGQ